MLKPMKAYCTKMNLKQQFKVMLNYCTPLKLRSTISETKLWWSSGVDVVLTVAVVTRSVP